MININKLIKEDLEKINIDYEFNIDRDVISYIKLKKEGNKHTFYIGVKDYNFNFYDLRSLLEVLKMDVEMDYKIRLNINPKFIIEFSK